ncbi:uncharacterized protein LOC124353190 [Homalodisca vitripennis]|uniref:uncharacterized protein LOC124353190 n=1 Tax=Homalodisca vitripennis TaxID=197043 RepID=UPI001EE9F26A|nr:uncharacterized protein LOC124353190 [Homalodisca vitripennis]
MEGTHVADGSNVPQDELYDVHIRGHDGTIISELLIKRPLDPDSEGIYQCEAWPHIHNGGYPFGPYPPYTPPRSDVFIIGSNSLLENCYHICGFTPATNKLGGLNNKQSVTNNDKDTNVKQNLVFKPRRNVTESRKDSNSKQLRYNLKYIDNTLYNVDGVNVTAEYFRPSKDNPFNLSRLS